jgi:O-antigen/teichoic acid export membrane protein
VSLKEKTVRALFWSFSDNFINLGGQFIVGIVLARILTAREFGLVGMLSIFIAISQTFIDSGFSNALIRKQNCTQRDYSTVFYFNFIVSLLCYLILFIFSESISSFFKEPQLKLLLRVLGLGLIFNSFGLIQKTIFTKNINFKTQAKASAVATLGSSIIAIVMALNGYGVWSLVSLTLSRYGLLSVVLWIWAKWKPALIFCKKSFHELFYFGSKLLISSLLETIYNNIYYLVIGKFFSAVDLGFYSRADQFQSFPSSNLQSVIGRVSFPVLAQLQYDKDNLKMTYQRIIKNTMFISFCLMLGLVAIARPLILTLLGEKWEPSIIYLQLLCFVGMFFPLHSINLNMLQVQGRSDLFLKIEIIKKILAVPIIILGIAFGIKAMIYGMILHSFISLFLNSYWSGRFIGYSFSNQIRDIFPSFVVAFLMGFIVYSENLLLSYSPLYLLIIQILSGTIFILILCECFKIEEYRSIKEVVKPYFKKMVYSFL